MKVCQLLQNDLVDKYMIIGIYRKTKTMNRWEELAVGYPEDITGIPGIEHEDIKEFYWKSYPNEIRIFI